MEIKILRINFENIRDFHKLTIPLFKNSEENIPHHISMIQMPNGTGKTTTMNLLRAVLSGSELDSETVSSYKPTRIDANEGSFSLLLSINNELFSLKIIFDYRKETMKYETSKPKEKGGGISHSYDLPISIKNVLTKNFTRLFIFDGEFSENILDKTKTEAESSIKFLYFLDRLELLKKQADNFLEKERNSTKLSNVSTRQGLKQQETEVKKLQVALSELLKELEEAIETREEFIENKSELEKKNEQILLENESIQEEYQELTSGIDDLEDEIKTKTTDLIEMIRTPSQFSHKIHKQLSSLSEKMLKLKLPRSISTEFFKELSEEKECICGRPIDHKSIKETILINAEKFLDEDYIITLNCIKGSIRTIEKFENKDSLKDEIVSKTNDLKQLNNERDLLNVRLDKIDQKRAETIKNEINEIERKIENYDYFIESRETKDPAMFEMYSCNEYNNIELCRRKLKKAKERRDEATQTVTFSQKVSLLKDIINKIIENSMTQIKKDMLVKSNQKIFDMMGNEDVIIDKIEGCIKVVGKRKVSQGQSLAVAYAFLTTLFEDSPHSVPFVVDSPVGSLDLEVRREVSLLIPKLFSQLIVFIISSERVGFIEGIEKNKDVQYCTIYKDSKDPMVTNFITTKDFFMKFHSEKEEEI